MSTRIDPKSHGIKSVSIVGAGTMGREIAMVIVDAGFDVCVSDIDTAVAAGVAEDINTACRNRQSHDGPKTFGTVRVANADADIANADLIIEAVAERIDIKLDLFSRLEPLLRKGALLVSNSSTIPMRELGASLTQPASFCGLHFCHPATARPLVEIIGAESTSQRTLARIHAFAESIGMSPIEVQDSPGFLLNRVLVAYLNESMELVLEGVDPEVINRASLKFGFPAGPFAQLDEIGIDVAMEAGKTLCRSFPDRILPSSLLIGMYKAGRLGRKSGAGFYFENGTQVDAMVTSVKQMIVQRGRKAIPVCDQTVEYRLLVPMFLEATRALEESIVDHPATIDRALRDGLGMTEQYAGLFGWADLVGAKNIVDWLGPLRSLGSRFEPTEMLCDSAMRDSSPFLDWRRAA